MVWLIGQNGMLGSDVRQQLENKNIEFIASDAEVDITNKKALLTFVCDKVKTDIDFIINCSAYTAVDKAEDEKEKAFLVNAEGVENIAKLAAFTGASLLHVSTDYVFDGTKGSPYTETDEPNPQSIYGKSKLAGEEAIKACMEKYFILRTAWLYGRNGSNFVHTMLKLFESRDELGIVSDQWGSPTWSMDLARTIVSIITADTGNYGIYHTTNNGKTTWFDFTKAIHDLAKKYGQSSKDVTIKPIKTEDYPVKAPRPSFSVLSNEKLKHNFDIQMPAWSEALEEYMEGMKK